MKNFLGGLLILACLVTQVILHLPGVAKLHTYPTIMLEQELKLMQITTDASSILNGTSEKKNSSEKFYYKVELARRAYGLGWLSIAAGIFGLGLLALQFLTKTEASRKPSRVRVTEAMPSESYVEESDFYRKSQDAFPSKDEALFWFENDPLRTCSYCGSPNMKPVRGQVDEVQLTTFYKKVPNTAKDLRIVLGSCWFVRPAGQLQCENCQQQVNR